MGKLELVQRLDKHRGRVWNVAWDPTGEMFASCGEDKTIRLYSKLCGKWSNKVILTDCHQRTIRQIIWSSCGNFIASASFDGTTSIWEKKTWDIDGSSTTLEGHENEVKSVSWSKDGQFLATCGRDKSVWIWEVTEEQDGGYEYECGAIINAHTQDVKKVIWHPSKNLLASASYDNTIKLYREDVDLSDWSCIATLESHTSTVWSIAFDAKCIKDNPSSGDRLASCSDDCTIKIWREFKSGNAQNIPMEGETTWKCICTLAGYHTRTVYDISWCGHSGLIASACGDDMIRIFEEDAKVENETDVSSFSMVASELAHLEDVNCVTWNPSGNGLLLSCSDDGEIKLWKYVTDST